MDDEIQARGGWHLDPDTRLAMRLMAVREAFSDGDWAKVVVEAEELLDDAPEHGETLGLLANALLELGDTENATEAFEGHLRRVAPTADALSGLAVARFETVDLPGASQAAREALRLDPGLAEAHYTLGLVQERQGDAGASAQSLHTAFTLSPEHFPLPLRLSDGALEQALRDAVADLDPRLVEFWREVPILVEEEPTLEELRSGTVPIPPTVAGLYVGDPEGDTALNRPEGLRLFKKNLARCANLDQVADRIASLLEQEALDWLGTELEEA